ncbi:hypothetical protein GUJ93_ZPchr0010g8624 [Zizania palustris]|uniref:Uncharacterized protein n=1 Tax=Zizania palustris TaxID=103762 RepID=A0A8J5WCR9_ZIZPA|nr:hypothetical protein GUJ93_ZPchr0010g8624 [Zizania palustris]
MSQRGLGQTQLLKAWSPGVRMRLEAMSASSQDSEKASEPEIRRKAFELRGPFEGDPEDGCVEAPRGCESYHEEATSVKI